VDLLQFTKILLVELGGHPQLIFAIAAKVDAMIINVMIVGPFLLSSKTIFKKSAGKFSTNLNLWG